MKTFNTPTNGDYRHFIFNSLEITLERRNGHDMMLGFSCEATNPEKFLEVATSLLEENTIMHLKAHIGVEYDFNCRNARAAGVDENNCCIHVAFDVDPDPAINQHRLERFLDLAIDGVNLCDFKVWRPHVERYRAKSTQVTITLDETIVDQLEKFYDSDPTTPLSLQVENTVKHILNPRVQVLLTSRPRD